MLGFTNSLRRPQNQPGCRELLRLQRPAQGPATHNSKIQRQLMQSSLDFVLGRHFQRETYLVSVGSQGGYQEVLDHRGARCDAECLFLSQAAAPKVRQTQQEKA